VSPVLEPLNSGSFYNFFTAISFNTSYDFLPSGKSDKLLTSSSERTIDLLTVRPSTLTFTLVKRFSPKVTSLIAFALPYTALILRSPARAPPNILKSSIVKFSTPSS